MSRSFGRGGTTPVGPIAPSDLDMAALRTSLDQTFATDTDVINKRFRSWASLMGAETWAEAKARVPSWGAAFTNETWGSL